MHIHISVSLLCIIFICIRRKALRTTYIFGLGSGFTDGIIFVTYAIVFRFGTFLITLDEDHVLHEEFDDIYT